MNPRDFYYEIHKQNESTVAVNIIPKPIKEPAITLTKRQDEFYDNLFKYFLHLSNTGRV